MKADYNSFIDLIYSIEEVLKKCDIHGKKVLVAISGGADSVALLYSLMLVKDLYNLDIYAVHVEHGLRQNSSMEDANFVAKLCRTLNIKLFIEHIIGLNELTGSIENNARIARYNAFSKTLKENNIKYLFLAHHANDQVETMLLNIFRGSGIDGLSAMNKVSCFDDSFIIRPFLNISKENILKVLYKNNIEYRIDESNNSNVYKRNAIRLDIIPEIQKIYPNFIESMLRLSSIAKTDTEYFENIINDIINKYAVFDNNLCIISLDAFANLDKALSLRLIRRMYSIARHKFIKSSYLDDLEHALSYDATLNLYDSIYKMERDKQNINGNIFASVSYKYLHFYTSNICQNDISIKISDIKNQIFKNKDIELIFTDDKHLSDGVYTQSIPKSLLDRAELRFRKDGDIINPFGINGTKSLKKYFIDKKIDREFRNIIPLLAIENNILWVMGVGCSNLVKNTNNEICTTIIIKSNMPWARKEK